MKVLNRWAIIVLMGLAPLTSHAMLINSSDYSLTEITGSWAWGSSGWNQVSTHGFVDNIADLATVETMMSDGYVDDFGQSAGVTNGIYTWPSPYNGSLIFEFNGGTDYLLDELEFISTRSYSGSTVISLDYSLDGGVWQNVLSATTTDLGMHPLLDGNLNPGTAFTLGFGGITADAFRLSAAGSDQISLHEIAVSGSAAVPEPATLALFGIGLAGLGFARKKRKSA